MKQAIVDKRLAISIDPALKASIENGVAVFEDSSIEVPPDKMYPLPFSLLEKPSTPGYFPVQTLPFVGIERGCFEPLNETGALLDPPTRKRYFGGSAPDACNHVRPMYWKSAMRIDFDGDRKEDNVFFKPQGSSKNWGRPTDMDPSKVEPDDLDVSETDFLVYQSGAAYSHARSLLTFNLSTERSGSEPHPLPIVADYDADGQSDFAVFEPASGKIRVALSSRNYALILEADVSASISDPSGELGLVAIPGNYKVDGAKLADVQLAIIQTGGAAADRFKIYVTSPIKAPDGRSLMQRTKEVLPNSLSLTELSGFKPKPGTVSVPAFSDYDDDGVTEAGWLSWYGGNLAKRVMGKVPEPSVAASGWSRFSAPTGSAVGGSGPLNVVMNPFDTAFDSAGNMYYLDSVDSRLWKITKPSGDSRGEFKNATVSAITARGFVSNLTEADFPKENVLNIPNNAIIDAASESTTPFSASLRKLKNPRKILVAPDGAIYVSDFGNGRIVMISGTSSRVVIGDARCVPGATITTTCYDLPGTGSTTWAALDLGGTIPGTEFAPGFSPRIYAASLPSAFFAGLLSFRANELLSSALLRGQPLAEAIPRNQFAALAPSPTPKVIEIDPEPEPSPLPGGKDGKFKMFPIAIEAVPENSSGRYSLAFSSGTSVYVLSPKAGVNRGPIGEDGEVVYKIAGVNANALPTPLATPVSAVDKKTFFNLPAGSLAKDTAICPVADLKYGTLGGVSLFAASSCSLATVPGGSGDLTKNVGGIIKIKASSGSFTIGYNTIESLAGGFWETPCKENLYYNPPKLNSCSGPINAGAPGIYQRKIDISATNSAIQLIDMINPVDLEWGPDNTLLFIDQWNSSPDVGSAKYQYSPNRTDHQYQQGVYALALDSSGYATEIIPLTNPLSFGSGTVPVESAHWRSPYSPSDGNIKLDITAHEAPVKNVPFAAVAALAVDETTGMLYTSVPWLQNPSSYNCAGSAPHHPYCAKLDNVGFINKMELDFDGDWIRDDQDSEISGFLGRSVKEKIGQPVQSFFKLNGSNVNLPGSSSTAALNPTSLASYFFMNSVSECGREENCVTGDSNTSYYGASVRQEVWATLLNFGDDQDFTWADKTCTHAVATNIDSPYFNCDITANGPIAAPAPLQTFVGMEGYYGKQFYKKTVPNPDIDLSSSSSAKTGQHPDVESALYQYPVVLSSTMPKENGIKAVRGGYTGLGKPTLRESGVVCDLLGFVTYSSVSSPEPLRIPQNKPFKLNMNNFLMNYAASGLKSDEDYNVAQGDYDNDSLNYFASCDNTATGTEATEAVVLQVDHDDTLEREAGASASNYPGKFQTGPVKTPENMRQLLLIDTDGDGVPNPSWYTSESILSESVLTQNGVRDFKSDGPFTFISTGLRKLTVTKSIKDYLDEAREPLTSDELLNELGLTSVDINLYRKPAYYAEEIFNTSYASFDGSRDTGRETLYLSLDFEPYVARTLKFKWKEDFGASGYANYVKDNRYAMLEYGGSGEFPQSPGMNVAENFISKGLNIEHNKITHDLAKYNRGEAELYLSFVNKDGDPCDENLAPSQPEKSCTHMLAMKRSLTLFPSASGNIKAVSKKVALPVKPHMHRECDPSSEVSPEYPCPGA